MTEFWLNNIGSLINKENILKLVPSKDDSFEEQLNSLTRTVLIVTLSIFAFTRSFKYLLSGLLCVLAIVIVYKSKSKKEGFLPGMPGMPGGGPPGGMPGMPGGGPPGGMPGMPGGGPPGGMPGMPGGAPQQPASLIELEKIEKNREEMFKKREKENKKRTMPTKKNPLMNVLLPQIQDDPHRPQAAKSYEPKVEKKINDVAADPRIFSDLGDNINFIQSMRNFYTTASSTVPNSQKDFAEFCYGNMASCKDNDYLQCYKNNERYIKI